MYHNAMIVMIGIKHIPISNRVNAALLSCGEFCIAVERGNEPFGIESDADEVLPIGGAAKGASFSGSVVSLLGRFVIFGGLGWVTRQAILYRRLLYFGLAPDRIALGHVGQFNADDPRSIQRR